MLIYRVTALSGLSNRGSLLIPASVVLVYSPELSGFELKKKHFYLSI